MPHPLGSKNKELPWLKANLTKKLEEISDLETKINASKQHYKENISDLKDQVSSLIRTQQVSIQRIQQLEQQNRLNAQRLAQLQQQNQARSQDLRYQQLRTFMMRSRGAGPVPSGIEAILGFRVMEVGPDPGRAID